AERTLVMGVRNVTPDSFSDGGQFLESDAALSHAKQMVADGADIIDIGGESSRPGSEAVAVEEELKRVLPVIDQHSSAIPVPISIDTRKPEVARAAVAAGAGMVNDITGLRNPEMVKAVAELAVPVVIMHMQGEPKTMQENPHYNDAVEDIKAWIGEQAKSAQTAGISDIVIDPGIGFGKTVEHNLEILQRLREFESLGYPILVGPSRKSFIGQLTGAAAHERIAGTLAAVTVAAMNGAAIVRVHDVKECRQALAVADAIRHV
ncbi:MAG: dihydropteroate synthase, partial [Patescibacteria group bacterium]